MILIVQILLLLLLLAPRFSAGNLTDVSIDLCSNDTVDYNNYTTLNYEDCCCETCIRKCCRRGFYYYHAGNSIDGKLISGCRKGELTNFSVPVYDIDKKVRDIYDGFSVGILNCTNQEVLEFNLEDDNVRHYFYIQQNGCLYNPHDHEIYDGADYCVDEKNGIPTYYFCIDLVEKTLLIHVAAKIIPVPFLLATFLVFVILPERTIHRKALIFHTLCLILGNILTALSQFYIIEIDAICIGSGYIMLYCLSTSYFWMNVMCIDIWLAFSGICGFRGRTQENALFIFLSIYAWGIPALILSAVVLLDAFGDENESYWPGTGKESCFLRDLPSLIFYFGPTIALIVFNSILFILTTINIQRTKREAAMLERADSGRHNNTDDEKFTLYWNLLFVMGINPIVNSHLIQLISWTVGWLASSEFSIYFIYYKDFAHAMYGIVIFIIFVCKKRIWKELEERYRQFTGKPKDNESSTSTTLSIKSPNEIAMSDVRLTNFKNKTSTEIE